MSTRTTTRSAPTATAAAPPDAIPDGSVPAPTGGQYRQVPLGELRTNPLNGRRKLTDIEAMADSIRAVGILEPLVVVPTDDGLLIVFGHRRHAGAQQAGLSTVPAIVRTDLDEAQVLQAAIIENTHRANLTPVEEADQLRRLMDLRTLTVTDLAASVGRNPAYVSGRLALLTLPARARDALEAGTITLDVAGRLTDLTEHPDLIDELIDPSGHIDPDRLDAAAAHVALEREATRLQEEAAAKGLRLVGPQLAHRPLAVLDLSPGQAGAHRRQSCHAVHLVRSYGKPRLVPVCTQPDRHQRTRTAQPGPDRPPANPTTEASAADPSTTDGQPTGPQPRSDVLASAASREQQARERDRNRKRVAKARRAFLTHLVGKRIKRAEAMMFVFASVLDRANHTELGTAGAILDLTPTANQWGQKDWRAAITEYAATDSDRIVKAAFVTACTWAEAHINPHIHSYNGPTAAYIAVLAALGYTPDPYETEQVDANHSHHTPTPSDPEPDTNNGDTDERNADDPAYDETDDDTNLNSTAGPYAEQPGDDEAALPPV